MATAKMTPEEIKRHSEIIDNMTQEDMARLWRFAPTGHPYFNATEYPELCDFFHTRFRGMTPELSKKIGWGDIQG